ncbi:hypothetical protein TWF696_001577 [Orbilia brochopaga]|uniref:Uncharacterized protein n=1 Tax=Orbilia brochopaga TaxID=3140254 RepID=A0AAV9UD15_9PEZI
MPPQRRSKRARSAQGRLQVGPYNRRTSPEPPVTTIRARQVNPSPPAPLPSILPAPTLEGCPANPPAPSRDADMSNEGPIPSRMPWDVRLFVREQRLNFNREHAAAGGTPLSSTPFLLSDEREASPMGSRDSRQRASSLPREIEHRLRRVRKGGVTKKAEAKSSKAKKTKKAKASRGNGTRPSRRAASQMTAEAPTSHAPSVPSVPSNPATDGNRAGDVAPSPHTGRLARPMWLERLGEITMQRTLRSSETKENKEPRQRGTRDEAIRVRDQVRRAARPPPPGLNGQEAGGEGGPRAGNGLPDAPPVRLGRDNADRGRSMARGNDPVEVAPTVPPPRPLIPRHESELPRDAVLLTGANARAEMAFRRDVVRLNRASDRNFRRVQEQQPPQPAPHQYVHRPRQGLSEIPMNVLNNGPVQVRGRQVAQGTATIHQPQEGGRRHRELLRRVLFE